MYTEVTVILVQGFQCGDVRSSCSNLIHPLDSAHHFVPLLLGKDRWSLVLGNLLWIPKKKKPVTDTYRAAIEEIIPIPQESLQEPQFVGQGDHIMGIAIP